MKDIPDIAQVLMQGTMALMDGQIDGMRDFASRAEGLMSELGEAADPMREALMMNLAQVKSQLEFYDATGLSEADLFAQLQTAEAAGDDATLAALTEKYMRSQAGFHDYIEASGLLEDGLSDEVRSFFEALEAGDVEMARLGLGSVDVNGAYGEFGKTPLYAAVGAERNKVALVRLLLQAGADPMKGLTGGYTPLHAMSDMMYNGGRTRQALVELGQMLIFAGADLHAETEAYGWTPLQRAVSEGDALELEVQLILGGDPNRPFAARVMPEFNKGRYPIHAAVSAPEKLQLLLDHGADPSVRDRHGLTALDHATQEVARLEVEEGQDRFQRDYIAGLQSTISLLKRAPRPC